MCYCCAVFVQYITCCLLFFDCSIFFFKLHFITSRHWPKLLPPGIFFSSYSLCIRNCLHSLHTNSAESQVGGISILRELPLLMKLSVTCASNTTTLTDRALQPQWANGRAALCFPVSSAYVRATFEVRTGNCTTLHHMAAPTLTVSYKFLNNKRW